MKNLLTINIGIPAYNEQKTITRLVKAIVAQKNAIYQLDKIIVALDGCTDQTETKLRELKLKNLVLIVNKNRQGKATVLDQIVSKATADALIVCDADITIKDTSFIDKLVAPIAAGKADLTTAQVVALKPTNLFTKILDKSTEFKLAMYETWNTGNNLYTCHGRALCMSRKLYQKIEYKDIIADDAWAYLTAKSLKLPYQYVQSAKVFYTLPQTVGDHMKQSMRFYRSQKQLTKYVSSEVLKQEYTIPRNLVMKHLVQSVLKHPVSMTAYVGLLSYIKFKTLINPKQKAQWEVATSSKL
ncbi:MAG: glycosyltransferase family 2 protein [Weeksellaceae bacterium]